MPNVPSKPNTITKGGQGRQKSNPPSPANRGRKKRHNGRTGGPVGAATPGSTAYNFHGSFSAATKVIQAKDLGIPVGTILYVSSIRFEYAASTPTILSLSVADLAVKGSDDISGPRSSNHLAVEGAIGRFSFKNPNALLYWTVIEDTDVIATIFSSSVTSVLTFSGTVQVRLQGTGSHSIG